MHWSVDSQLGSVISHSMEYASRGYLDRCVNELPRTFHYERDVPARGGRDARKYYDELVAYTKKHLDELFTNYGEIDVIFLDGGHKAELAEYVHQIAPDCLVTRGEMVTPVELTLRGEDARQKLVLDDVEGFVEH